MPIETNCFKISGLENLNTSYRLFPLAGLSQDSPDYYSNVQKIIRELSFAMKAPITTHLRDGETLLLVPEGCGDPPSHINLVGLVAAIRNKGETLDLSFAANSTDFDDVRMRFLQFAVQDPLFRDARLWQPGAGKPFYFRKPTKMIGGLELFEGFTTRVVPHPEGGFGIIVDIRRKLISRAPLSSSITREEVNRLKGRSCLYRMGENWFEVSLSGLSDLTVGEPSIQIDGKVVSLIDYLHSHSRKPVPASLANLSPEGAAILYRTNGPQQRSAPAELCFLISDTHAASGARSQPETIIEPAVRHTQIQRVVQTHLHSLKISGVTLKVSNRPALVREEGFAVPDLLFGKDTALVRGKGDYLEAVRDYGRKRLRLLDNASAGFFEQSPLGRQYFVLPRSILNSAGPGFVRDLKSQMLALYPCGGPYEPEIIDYDDLNGKRDFGGQSRAIKSAMETARVQTGTALVMVHSYDRRARSADQLAAWVVKEFNQTYSLATAVIHADMVRKAYVPVRRGPDTDYVINNSEERRVRGYLRNVAINKILLTNGKWPFVLKSKLRADVVIGIDVKNSTAAFTLIANGGKIIRFATNASRQKEQLLRNQVAHYVADLIRKERRNLPASPETIVVHRDGRAWPAEIEGIKDACKLLESEGFLDPAWSLTVLEISKSAPAPMRLFEVYEEGGSKKVANPAVGDWVQVGNDEGFLCTTGDPFAIPGTANPLHIRKVHGVMSIKDCVSDVFDLSCLTWGRPEGAMRLPISIKLCDRNLFELAEEVNEDEISFGNDNFAGQSQ